jgi:hypothetical protein
MTKGSAPGRAQATTATSAREREPTAWLPRMTVAVEQTYVSMGEIVLYASLALAMALLRLYLAEGPFGHARVEKASPHVAVTRALAAPVATGEPLASLILANVPREGVLVSADAQATVYVLKRNVVGLIDWRYSDARWDERAIRDLMTRFRAIYLVLSRRAESQSTAAEYVGDDSDFLRLLLDERPPAWLDRAASSRYALVYRLRR